MRQCIALLILVLACDPDSVAASELPRVDASITVDGIRNEAAWSHALRVELLFENSPGENLAAPVATVAYLFEDGKNLYVAFDAHDPDPKRILAWLRDRDSLGPGDFVGISLDTYDDGRRAYEFFVNPLGVQWDRLNDEVNDVKDSAWDAIWASAGRIDDHGYVVEMRIPLGQLRFRDREGPKVWRYRLTRSYPRLRNVSLSNIASDRDRNCSICQYPSFQGLVGAESGSNLEIVPTLTATRSSTAESDFAALTDNGTAVDAGLTVAYGVTPEITANLAINPDFSQVEADDAELAINNRFALVFPERRPFFLEGADYFRTPMQAVFTRSVESPDVAAKLTGRSGANTYAAFVARDDATNLLFPGSLGSDSTRLELGNSVWVGRYSREFQGLPSVGGLLTVRDGEGYENRVAGLDSRWLINDQHELLVQWLNSTTAYPDAVAEEFSQPAAHFDGKAFRLEHVFESRNWFSNVTLLSIDDGFRADTGFIRQADVRRQEYSFGRKWYADESWWARINLRGGYEVKDRQDGQLLEDTYIVALGLTGILQSSINLNVRQGREFDSGRLYDYNRMTLDTRFEPVGGLRLRLRTQLGDEIDVANTRLASERRLSPSLRWSLGRHLLLSLDGDRVELETQAGVRIFDASVVDARVTWQFGIRSSLRLTVQQTEVSRNVDVYRDDVEPESKDRGRQLLYSWKMNPQTVFFLGYSDSYARDDELDALVASDRRWFMKLGYAWTL
ncbi:MAG: DUF5916 domain-containing protein [Pseudomonadota bacterium]